MNTQPDAHRLADVLDAYHKRSEDKEAAALLRTQHADLERKDALLRRALDDLVSLAEYYHAEVEDLIAAITSELAK